ncbi:unnamed protein product [Allacma fusca]|uniref:Uncharacterized protein n=1 Tax=Allacma fusca TaxID=39272 RepID=A0A8J2KC34_9HEXA|nr:unnamed protein product [Allacma fusca]
MGRFGYESALNSTIHEMMDNPRARLFQFEDHWGEYEDYHFQRSGRMGMCSDLIKLGRKSIHLKAQIRGMVKNPIVRLFNGENLTGDSNDFHSGQTRRFIHEQFDKLRSSPPLPIYYGRFNNL